MVHHCICIRVVCTVCVCMQSGAVNHAECALALPRLSCQSAPIGVQPLMAIDMVEMALVYTTHLHSSPTQDNRTTSCWAQTRAEDCISTSFWWIYTQPLIEEKLSHTNWITSFGIVGCLVACWDVGVWVLQPDTECTSKDLCTSLRVRSLPMSGMQRAGGLDLGWGKWAKCVWVLSPCGVIVDRDGSRSGRGQRRGNTSSHHWTWGWQLFGLHRYCCCFPTILPVFVNSRVEHNWSTDFGLFCTLSQTSHIETVYGYTFATLHMKAYYLYQWYLPILAHTVTDHVLTIKTIYKRVMYKLFIENSNQRDYKMHLG